MYKQLMVLMFLRKTYNNKSHVFSDVTLCCKRISYYLKTLLFCSVITMIISYNLGTVLVHSVLFKW